MFRTRIPRVLAAALAGAVALVLAHGGPAAANPPPDDGSGGPTCPTPTVCHNDPDPLPPFYFGGLGDSYWSGEGASHTGTYASNTPGVEEWPHRSGMSPLHVAWMLLEEGRRPLSPYTLNPTSIQHSWGGDRFALAASSGAKTKHLTETQWENDNQTIKRNDPQLDQIDPGSHVVFFGLGGNDAGFGDLMSTAVKSYYKNRVLLGRTDNDWHKRQLDAVQLEVLRLLNQMNQVALNVYMGLIDTHNRAQHADIVVGLYPIGLRPSGNYDITEVGAASLDVIRKFGERVNQAILDGVQMFRAFLPDIHIHVFDPNTAGPNGTSVTAGHEIGSPAPWFNGVKIRQDELAAGHGFRSHQESFHPNEFGAVAVGKALADFMAREFPNFFPNGPNYNYVNMNPQASVDDPAALQQSEQFAASHPDLDCVGTDADSICRFIDDDGGITVPIEAWQHPIKLQPLPGGPVAGGPDSGGSPAGNPNPSTWTPGGYPTAPSINIPWQNPCYVIWEQRSPSTPTNLRIVTGPGLQPIDALLTVPSQPVDPCDVFWP